MDDIAEAMRLLFDPPLPAGHELPREVDPMLVQLQGPIAEEQAAPAAEPRHPAPLPEEEFLPRRPAGFQGPWSPLEIFEERILFISPTARGLPRILVHAFATFTWARMTDEEQRPYWDAHNNLHGRRMIMVRREGDPSWRIYHTRR